jgi:DNA polymerase III alpha subunit
VQINEYGDVILNEHEVVDAIYKGQLNSLSSILLDDPEISQKLNDSIISNNDNIDLITTTPNHINNLQEFDKHNQKQWLMPKEYCPNLVEFLYGQCTTEEQTNRVSTELDLFIQHGMFDLLFYLKYLVDTMRENSIVWGVGRGSSVASYILYLIGVHKIDSLKYNLDIHEFLK